MVHMTADLAKCDGCMKADVFRDAIRNGYSLLDPGMLEFAGQFGRKCYRLGSMRPNIMNPGWDCVRPAIAEGLLDGGA